MSDPNDLARLTAFGGDVLDARADSELDQIVAEAARVTGYPIALVSLVLPHTQLFRAHTGLPSAIALAGATNRNASFCQFVASSGAAFEVTSARDDARVPKDLVDRYGIQAYHGLPLNVGGHTLGSLCVIDVKTNQLTAASRTALGVLADRAAARLNELRMQRVTSELVAYAVEPAFGEIRNLLLPLFALPEMLRIASAELAPIARLTHSVVAGEVSADELFKAMSVLGEAADSQPELEKFAGLIESTVSKLMACLNGLENTVAGKTENVPLNDVIAAATQTTHHATKLLGGVRWPPVEPNLRVRGLGTSPALMLAMTLHSLCQHSKPVPWIEARVHAYEQEIRIDLRASVDESASVALARQLNQLSGHIMCEPCADGITLRLPRA